MEKVRSQYEDVPYPGCIKGVQVLTQLLGPVWVKHAVWSPTGGGAEPSGVTQVNKGQIGLAGGRS